MKKFEEMEFCNQIATLERFKRILKELETEGKANICPCFEPDVDCSIFFPRANCYNRGECPCEVYPKEYLIKKVKEIIEKRGKGVRVDE